MAFKIPDTPEELFKQGSRNISQLNKYVPFLLILFVLLVVCLTSFYSVEQDEVGVIRRFGKYTRTTEPGLHWKLPFNIEKLDKVKVKRVFKEEFGFRTVKPGVNTTYSSKSFDDEALMLTGDLNVLDVTWVVHFKIRDPLKLLFNIRNPRDTVRDVSEAIMRQTIGDYTVTEALTTMKNEINLNVKTKMQVLLDLYDTGIYITEIELQEVLPPAPVAASFNEVNTAEQEREKIIYQALQTYEQVINKERGKAQRVVKEAEGYALTRVNEAKGDAEKFIQTWKAYKEAKDVTRRRLYLEALEEIIPQAGGVYIMEPKANNILPLMNLTAQK